MADYRARPGAPNGCYGNRVYNNRIHVSAEAQKGVDTYLPMAWAIYYSASGGDNDVFGNEIVVNKPDLNANVLTTAFYICGGVAGFGGRFYNNTITTNVPAAWIGTLYGSAVNSKIYNNTIVSSPDAPADLKPFSMGWSKGRAIVAKNIEFRSNEIVGSSFDVDRTDEDHSFSVYWSLAINVLNKTGKPLSNAQVIVRDKNNRIAYSSRTDKEGSLKLELPEYSVEGPFKIMYAPYTAEVGKTKMRVTLNKNSSVNLVTQQ